MTRWYMVPRERNDDVIEWVMVEPDMGVLAPEEVYFVSYVFFHLCLFSNVFFFSLKSAFETDNKVIDISISAVVRSDLFRKLKSESTDEVRFSIYISNTYFDNSNV